MTTKIDTIIDRTEVRRLTTLSESGINRPEKLGKFPLRIPLGAGRVGWSRTEVLDWIEATKLQRTQRRGE